MSPIEAVRYLIGLAALIFVIEDWCLRPQLSHARAWASHRVDYRPQAFFDLIYSDRAVTLGLALRAAAAVSLLVAPHALDALVLALGVWWWAVRWRGNFNGASDSMTMIVLAGLALFLWTPDWAFAAQVIIGVNLILSFVVAGLAKLASPAWRSGEAPRHFAANAGLTLPSPKLCAWGVMAFEISFPLALLDVRLTVIYTALGLVFHVANARAFGLSRFLLAWIAAYPSLFALNRG